MAKSIARFPFDNRVAILALSGQQLKTLFAAQVPNLSRRAGVSGLNITVRCTDGKMAMDLRRVDGRLVADDDVLRVIANDFLLLGGDNIFTPITPADGFVLDSTQPLVRDIWVDWFRTHGGSLNAADYSADSQRRWHLPDPLPSDCAWPQ